MSTFSFSVLPTCKQCLQKRCLLNWEVLAAVGGLCLGMRGVFFRYPNRTVIAYSVGAISLCVTHSVYIHFPASNPRNIWFQMALISLSGLGIGWCMELAFNELPKSAIVSFCAGALSICLTNSFAFHVPNTDTYLPKRKPLTQADDQDFKPESSSLPNTLSTEVAVSMLDCLHSGEILCSECHSMVKTLVHRLSNEEKQPEASLPIEKQCTKAGIYREIKGSCVGEGNGKEDDDSYGEDAAYEKEGVPSDHYEVATLARPAGKVWSFLECRQTCELRPTTSKLDTSEDETVSKSDEHKVETLRESLPTTAVTPQMYGLSDQSPFFKDGKFISFAEWEIKLKKYENARKLSAERKVDKTADIKSESGSRISELAPKSSEQPGTKQDPFGYQAPFFQLTQTVDNDQELSPTKRKILECVKILAEDMRS